VAERSGHAGGWLRQLCSSRAPPSPCHVTQHASPIDTGRGLVPMAHSIPNFITTLSDHILSRSLNPYRFKGGGVARLFGPTGCSSSAGSKQGGSKIVDDIFVTTVVIERMHNPHFSNQRDLDSSVTPEVRAVYYTGVNCFWFHFCTVVRDCSYAGFQQHTLQAGYYLTLHTQYTI
jgi:hypothetical protein